MRLVPVVAAVLLMNAAIARAQAPVTPGLPPPQVVPPAQDAPIAPAPGTPGQVVPTAPVGPVPPVGRVFTTPTGLLFNTVRPERVADFEAVIWYLQQALQSATNPTVRAQARGWRVFRATEPGPNATVLYVFVIDPVVPKADYGLGRILADAYPEKVQEIWRLYQGSVTGGGSLLNLAPVESKEPLPLTAPSVSNPETQPPPRTPPPPTTAR